MKILFFIALLINIVFFLWEISTSDLNAPLAKSYDDKSAKQILLVSELSNKNTENDLISVEKESEKKVQFDSSEVDPVSMIDLEPILTESRNQEVEGLTVSEELSGNEVELDAFDKKNEVEQHTSRQTLSNISANNQSENDKENLLLDQNNLVEYAGKDEKNELTQVKSFWPDFSLIFDKENNYSSQMDDQPDARIFSKANNNKDVGSSSLSSTLKNWSVSIFGQPINNEDGISNSQKNNNKIAETQSQIKKTYCYEVGPFASQKEIEKWRESNKINTTSLKQFKKNHKFLSSYLVYHPAEDTFEKSKTIAKAYEKKGISEVWLFRKGSLRGAISFGLFKQEKRALRLQKKLIKNGLYVEILERFKTQPVQYTRIFTKDKMFDNTITISDKQIVNECNYAVVGE